jgi:hypothetical protein
MPKVKISEYSSTANSNTDVASINIDEGCAPSGINNAIRAVMGHLKDFQTGAVGDPFNGPVNGTVGATTPAAGAFTTLSATGVTTVQAGSAGTPAITTSGDTNTGIFFPAADTIAFSEGGTESMRIDSSGNVGLGVTPSAWGLLKALQIQNASFAGLSNTTYVGSNVYFDGSNFKYISTAASTLYTLSNTAGQHQWSTAASGTAGTNITFTQAMTLDASGNLGIGTTSPTTVGGVALCVYDSSSPRLRLTNSTTGNTSTVGCEITANGSDFVFENRTTSANIRFFNNGAERMRLDSSGNLGIGTTSPGAALELTRASSDVGLYITRSGSGASNYRQFIDGDGDLRLNMASSANMRFFTSDSERMRITSTGSLLVGATSNPEAYTTKLASVYDGSGAALYASNASGGGDSAFIAKVTSTPCNLAYWLYGSTNVGTITTNGTTTSYNITSDYRLKNVVGTVTGQGERIDALKPIEYEWKSNGSRTRGFLAHEFQEVYADSVTGAKDAVDADGKPVYQAMQASTAEVIADLVAEIQSLRQRLAAANL